MYMKVGKLGGLYAGTHALAIVLFPLTIEQLNLEDPAVLTRNFGAERCSAVSMRMNFTVPVEEIDGSEPLEALPGDFQVDHRAFVLTPVVDGNHIIKRAPLKQSRLNVFGGRVRIERDAEKAQNFEQ